MDDSLTELYGGIQMTEKNTDLPRFPEPYWRCALTFPSFSKLDTDITTDVLIVGGGITGITSAYLLVKQGVKVTLIEARRNPYWNDRTHYSKNLGPAWLDL